MSTNVADDEDESVEMCPRYRYSALETGNSHVIYDRENPKAWVESTTAISLDDAR
jgi:hypothetical protein